MIGQPAAERFGRDRQPPGRAEVCTARARIAARVVVREHYGCAARTRCIENDGPERKIDAAAVAAMTRQVEAMGLVVEMGDPEGLLVRIALFEAAGEKGTRGGEPIEFQRRFGTLIPHASGVDEGEAADDANRIAFGT
jgi:hypothetical protein